MTYYWQCSANPNHVSADWRPDYMHHWNTKFCVQCSAPMIDVRSDAEKEKLLARSEFYRHHPK